VVHTRTLTPTHSLKHVGEVKRHTPACSRRTAKIIAAGRSTSKCVHMLQAYSRIKADVAPLLLSIKYNIIDD